MTPYPSNFFTLRSFLLPPPASVVFYIVIVVIHSLYSPWTVLQKDIDRYDLFLMRYTSFPLYCYSITVAASIPTRHPTPHRLRLFFFPPDIDWIGAGGWVSIAVVVCSVPKSISLPHTTLLWHKHPLLWTALEKCPVEKHCQWDYRIVAVNSCRQFIAPHSVPSTSNRSPPSSNNVRTFHPHQRTNYIVGQRRKSPTTTLRLQIDSDRKRRKNTANVERKVDVGACGAEDFSLNGTHSHAIFIVVTIEIMSGPHK